MMWYEKILAAHLDVTDQVSHIERMHSDRYFVWQEDGENVLAADDSHAERAVTGTTDLFTKQEFDPWVDSIRRSSSAATACVVAVLVQYEEDTGFIHYEWSWEVA